MLGLLVVALVPSAATAQEMPTGTTLPPSTTVAPDTTLPPATTEAPTTTVAEEPPATTVPPAPAVTEPEVTEPEGGPRTLTVTPSTGLVHGQTVVLRGRGWPPHQSGMGAAQCIAGTTDTRGCGPISFYVVDGAGNFRGDFRVTVLLDTALGTFDCRVEQCVLGANYTTTAAGARFVELGFDPAGPDPVRHVATVTPDTGLVDGQEVLVTGDGFHHDPGFGNGAYMLECRVPVAGRQDCDDFTAQGADVDVDGHVEAPYTVATILELPDGSTHDCRTGDCVLVVQDLDDILAEAALVPLGFDPGGALLPLPTLDATPNTGLVDGDRIHVTGDGWEPQTFVSLLLCRAGADTIEDCGREDLGRLAWTGSGHIDEILAVRTVLHTYAGDRVDCRVDACAVVATTNEALRRAVEVPLSFDPAGGLLDLTVEVRPDRGLMDRDEVLVTGTGGRPGTWLIARQCLARATSYRQCNMADLGGIFVPRRAGRADPTGQSFSRRLVVHRVLHLNNGERVDCALRPCVVAVSEEENLGIDARAAIDFARAGGGGDGDGGGDGVGPVTATPTFTG